MVTCIFRFQCYFLSVRVTCSDLSSDSTFVIRKDAKKRRFTTCGMSNQSIRLLFREKVGVRSQFSANVRVCTIQASISYALEIEKITIRGRPEYALDVLIAKL